MPEVPTVATSSEYLKYLFKNKLIKRLKIYKKISVFDLFKNNTFNIYFFGFFFTKINLFRISD